VWLSGAEEGNVVSIRLASRINNIRNIHKHRDFENYRDLVFLLVQKEIKVRYKNKFLGYLWSVASPLASALVYFIAFKIVMKVHVEEYPLVLISGLFPWQWFGNSVGSSPSFFLGNAWIIKKVNFPTNLLPLCSILNHMIHYVVSIPIVVIFLFVFHRTPTLAWLYGVPVLLIIQLVMLYGVSLVLATLNLFFRDLERLVSILMQFLFFLTPILYDPEMIPEGYRKIILFNPASPLIISWKELFLEGKIEPQYMLVSVIYAIFFLVLGLLVHRKLSWRFAEIV
jgi:lipopolysaccharide transport system permease protein